MEEHPGTNYRFLWMLAAASVVTASVMIAVAWGHYPTPGTPHAPGQFAEFRSNQIADVRGWIRQRTGLDIPLLAQPSSKVQLIGATIDETGGIELRYLAGNHIASLFVSSGGSGAPEHKQVVRGPFPNVKAVSWNMGHQGYTLAVEHAGNFGDACLVCHAESTL
jgi:hypothetical protein